EITIKYDPTNDAAREDLRLTVARMAKEEEDRKREAEFEATRARAQSPGRLPVPVLSARSQVPITLKFTAASLETISTTLGKLAGVNILFDEGFRDKKGVTVDLSGVTFEQALDQICLVNRLFYKVIDQNTLIIVPESPQKRRAYDESLVQTFYVQHAELNEIVAMVRTLTGVTKVSPNQALGAVTIIGTVDQLALARKIIESNDKPRGEVVVEIRIMEVDTERAKDYGIRLSSYKASATLAPL